MSKKINSSGVRALLDFLIYIASVVLICFLILRFVAIRSVVDGNSMFPFLSDKDSVIVEKVSYYFREPARYDVIVFRLKDDPKTKYIKSIVGLPGETVFIEDGLLYINGELMEDDVYCEETMRSGIYSGEAVTLGEDEYFVLGDNRNHSKDSRAIGSISKSQFVGRAWVRIWPLNQMKVINKKP